MKLLALDFGLQRVGVAVGDHESQIAFPRPVLRNDSQLFDRLQTIVHKEQIDEILVGNPIKRDGEPGDIEDDLRQFLSQLERQTGITPHRVDERFTSLIARQRLHDLGISEKDQRMTKDSLAAQILLETWFEQHSSLP